MLPSTPSVPVPSDPVAPIDCYTQGQIDLKALEDAKAIQQAAAREAAKHPENVASKAPSEHKFKKIFVFCDGTGNEFDANANSNVIKLYTTLRVTSEQVAYYHPGVGTMGDPTARHWPSRYWSVIKGLAFAAGFKANVMDAYRYLMDVYNDGDDIYLFGFSRGSYTARALAGMLDGYGLLCRGNEGHIPYAYNLFAKALKKQRKVLKKDKGNKKRTDAYAEGHSIKPSRAFSETFSRQVKVRFIGVFDTVSSVGWIYKSLRLLDMAKNPIIQVGRHAVSIDERRANYRDNLWGHPGKGQDIVQVWFPGVHSDVGGSYPQDECAPANVSLEWMIGELKNHGAELCKDRIAMVLGTATGSHAASSLYSKPSQPFHCLHNSLHGLWWILNLFPQQHYDKDDGKIVWRVPFKTPRQLPHGAFVHDSAIKRIDTPPPDEKPYRPSNLRREWLTKLTDPPAYTNANLKDCWVYHPQDRRKPTLMDRIFRWAALIPGWIYFGLFWFVLLSVMWFAIWGAGWLGIHVSPKINDGLVCFWKSLAVRLHRLILGAHGS